MKDADLVRQTIGYVPQERAIDRFLTGREHLELLADLYHLSAAEASSRIPQLLKLVELETHADRPAKTYSGGMKRKLDIACGLLPDPKILFLDEPTLGLDVQSRLRIWDHVRAMRDRGITVVMTTNYLDEADQLCDRIAIIDGGRIKAFGSPTELKVGLGGDLVSLTVREHGPRRRTGGGGEKSTGYPRSDDQAERTGYSSRFSREGLAGHPRRGQPPDLPARVHRLSPAATGRRVYRAHRPLDSKNSRSARNYE